MVAFHRSPPIERWVRTFIIALVIAFLVWFLGPMVGIGASHPLELEFVRILVVAGIFLFWLIWNLLQMIRAHRREKALAEGITQDPDAAAKEKERVTAEEVAVVGDRLKEAMTTLKKSKVGGSRKRLALLPWYMFIGPPAENGLMINMCAVAGLASSGICFDALSSFRSASASP